MKPVAVHEIDKIKINKMNKKQGLKTYSLDEITDKHIGKRGTPKREAFENELRLDLLGEAIRQARLERNLTQEELGRLVGVQKAQISKLENSLTDARFETIIKVFKALNAKINFNVELLNQTVKIA
ncbi:MAG TPA: helix-turn-helix transcriptional regulator [Chitinophagales bacterium]|nr:helix-turn-helix transcriptional regulator [Chitinophagales bacterium]